jgi:prevent-host-death family protein
MKHVGSYEAKTHLPALLDAVERGETVIITRRGRPTARLTPLSASTSDSAAAVEQFMVYSRKQNRKLRGIAIRSLINHGRRF